jgi:hypothetical protein
VRGCGHDPGDRLWVDLTVESFVLDPRFSGLFTEAEHDIARSRLDEHRA